MNRFGGIFGFPLQPRALTREGIEAICSINPNAKFVCPDYLGNRRLSKKEALDAVIKGLPVEIAFGLQIGYLS